MEEPKKKHPDRPESRALDPLAVRCVEASSVFTQVSKKNKWIVEHIFRKIPDWP
jgi:hypothetical protein